MSSRHRCAVCGQEVSWRTATWQGVAWFVYLELSQIDGSVLALDGLVAACAACQALREECPDA